MTVVTCELIKWLKDLLHMFGVYYTKVIFLHLLSIKLKTDFTMKAANILKLNCYIIYE